MPRSALRACAVLVSQVVFVVTIARGASCPERCPDDRSDGRCPPACTTCACAPRLAPMTRLASIATPPGRRETAPGLVLLVPGEPEPSDIFHVPKRLLA